MDQLHFPTFAGAPVADVHLRIGGTITRATDQVPRGMTDSKPGWMLVRYEPAGVEVKNVRDDDGRIERVWVNKCAITQAFELDADIAEPIAADIREHVETELDRLAGRAKLPMGEAA